MQGQSPSLEWKAAVPSPPRRHVTVSLHRNTSASGGPHAFNRNLNEIETDLLINCLTKKTTYQSGSAPSVIKISFLFSNEFGPF